MKELRGRIGLAFVYRDVSALSRQKIQTEFSLTQCSVLALLVAFVFFPPSAVAQVPVLNEAPLADTSLISDNELLPDASVQLLHQTDDKRPDTLIRAPYIGVGIGRSFLDPDSRDVSNTEIADDSQIGYQITLGLDINRWLSAELHATDLGDAELVDNSDISFRDFGLSALWYFTQNRAAYKREGLGFFGRAGLGYLSTSGGGRPDLDNTEGLQALLGVGLEFSMRQGLALRAEGVAYGQHASYLQLGLLYRFGGFSSWVANVPFIDRDAVDSQQLSAAKSANVARIVSANDTDGDGVLEANDSCPDTPETIAVGDNGCALFNGVIDGLTFLTDSAELSAGARVILQGVANSLLESPNARARVVAHTDNLGDASANMLLSRKRAFEVAKFLVESGIAKERLEARAFGELRPIDTNSTALGRQNNRRVEIDLIAE